MISHKNYYYKIEIDFSLIDNQRLRESISQKKVTFRVVWQRNIHFTQDISIVHTYMQDFGGLST